MAMIPAMTTGMIHFMISSGLMTDMAAIPVPDLAVPYAAPNAGNKKVYGYQLSRIFDSISTTGSKK